MSNRLQGKVAIVTGGASGIGEATARLFAENGASMVVIVDIQDDLGSQLAESIGHHRCSYVHCDVAKEDQVKLAVEATVKNFGRLDIMFSNAGIMSSQDQTLLDLDFPSFDRLFDVNVRGMAACVKHAAAAMVEGRVKGSIVCTASVLATTGIDMLTDYTMSKHAILGLMRSASIQLRGYGIRVNCVSPGPCHTAIMNSLLEGKSEEEMIKYGQVVFMPPEHVAKAVVFLASEDSQFVTGHNLVVDGTWADSLI